MTVTKIWKNIGWSFLADAEIKMVSKYTVSNDYIGSDVYINGEHYGGDCSERLALINAFEKYLNVCLLCDSGFIEENSDSIEDLAKWLLRR